MSAPINHAKLQSHRGFSMTEVLIAIFILSVGLIMVGSIFPVAIDWTRQSSEESTAITIARNAVAIIKTKYTKADFALIDASPNKNIVGALPSINSNPNNNLPMAQRAYAFGTPVPYPASNPAGALYFWTGLARQSPSNINSYDIFILVFHKGSASQTFPTPAAALGDCVNATELPANNIPIPGTYGISNVPPPSGNTITVPTAANWMVGSQVVIDSTGSVYRVIRISGTTLTLNGTAAGIPTPSNIIAVPPAVNGSASPLVYIYQTTVSF